jgi:DNA-binding IclR family transcriptional regulator
MLLSDIKQYLQQQPGQTLLDLSRQFRIEINVLREMLAVLVRKGQVRQCTKTPRCGTKCQQCSVVITEMYEWVAEENPPYSA